MHKKTKYSPACGAPRSADQLLRNAGDGCSKVQLFWASNIVAAQRNKRDVRSFVFGLTCFMGYLKGKACKDQGFPVMEPQLYAS
ncbi:hypothetical protein IOCL2690_000678400 [Leishmania lindenbergi]|uniref:Uncharacterized protein n=1 Tax=Leishmania lindenbergi TaxID=651832 RepID=A0AAW3A1B6_9TRYP